jgi:subtilisin family serine protease
MRQCLWAIVSICLLFFGVPWIQATEVMAPQLADRMAQAEPDELIRIYIIMERQADLAQLMALTKGLNKAERRQLVINRLREVAIEDQAEVLDLLERGQAQGKAARIRPLWLGNTVCCLATSEIIGQVATLRGIGYINWDKRQKVLHDAKGIAPKPPPPKLVKKVKNVIDQGMSIITTALSEKGLPSASKEIPWNITKINADDVWALGYTGEGVLVSHLDTGVNYNHLDLRDHMWDGSGVGMPHHGYDYVNSDTDPMDDEGHGTHTAGTIAADGTAGSQVGVAPDATIMVFKIWDADGYGIRDDAWSAMQYSSLWGADLISMSGGWPHEDAACSWRVKCDQLLAAGIVFVTSAGNGHPHPDTAHYQVPFDISTPADVPSPWYPPWYPQPDSVHHHSSILAIGATNSLDNIASFSSYGPTEWSLTGCSGHDYDDYNYPPGLLKPDVCAPGVSIKSLAFNDTADYAGPVGWAGTSMSCPHVAGTLALMLSKNPNLTPVQMDSILEVTALDRGPAGRDSLYGAGRIDALAAVQATPSSGQPPEAIVDLLATLTNGAKSSSGNIHLTWTEPSSDAGVDHYVIYRTTEPTLTMDSLDATTDTTYIDAAAVGETTTQYYYMVKAVDTLGQKSPESNKVGEFDIPLVNGEKSLHLPRRTPQVP